MVTGNRAASASASALFPAAVGPQITGISERSSTPKAALELVPGKVHDRRTAMDVVRRQYEDLGWQVDDVSARRLAWDLVCARDQDVRRVRVKGLTGDDGGIVVSAVEMDAARWIEDWTLAVV